MGASLWDQSTTAASNTDIAGVNQAEGCAPSTVNNATRGIVAQTLGALVGVAATGTDAYAATLAPAPAALTDGMEVHIRFANANTSTTPTLNINGLGDKTIVRGGSSALAIGDIPAAHEGVLRYRTSDTKWVLMNPNGATLAANTFALAQTINDPSNTDSDLLLVKKSGATAYTADDKYLVKLQSNSATSDAVLTAYVSSGTVNSFGIKRGSSNHVLKVNITGTPVEAQTWYPTGGVAIGSATDKGNGALNVATAIYENNARVLTKADALAPKSVVKFTGSTGAVLFGSNIGSVVRNGVGDYSIGFSVAFANANYVYHICGERDASNLFGFAMATAGGQTAGTLRIQVYNNSGVAFDPTAVVVTCIGS